MNIKNVDQYTGVVSTAIVPVQLREHAEIYPNAKKLTKSGHGTQAGLGCPACGWRLRVGRVNVSRCTRVGGQWKTSLECTNKKCRFTELSIKTLNEWRNN